MKKNIMNNATLIANQLSKIMNCTIRVQFGFVKDITGSVYPVAKFQKMFKSPPLKSHWDTIMDISVDCLKDSPHPFNPGAVLIIGNKCGKY